MTRSVRGCKLEVSAVVCECLFGVGEGGLQDVEEVVWSGDLVGVVEDVEVEGAVDVRAGAEAEQCYGLDPGSW